MTRLHVFLLAAAVAALVVYGVFAERAAGGPVASGFQPVDFTATSSTDWWLAGSAPCELRHPCLALVRTLDGGRSFQSVHVPKLADVGVNGNAQIAFADPADGFILGTRLWATHDGGRRWAVVNLGDPVQSIAVGGGLAYATVWGRKRGFLMRSSVHRDDWTTLAEGGPYFESLTVDNGVVLADREANPGGEQQILISHDQGATFTSSRPVQETLCGPQQPVPGVVWMLCRGGMMDGLYRSTDGGLTFLPPSGPTAGSQNSSGVWPGDSTLGAATGETAVIGAQQVVRTTDGGDVFKRVPLPFASGGWEVSFSTARDGLALGRFGEGAYPTGRLYRTTDAGANYHRVAIR